MPRLGSTFATPGRAAFGNAGVVPEADLTHAGCQSAYGIQQEQGFPSYFPSFVFVDSHTGQAHGDIDVSSVFLATQVVHEVDEPDASGIRGYYCLDYADLKEYLGQKLDSPGNPGVAAAPHKDAPGALYLVPFWRDALKSASMDPLVRVHRKPLGPDAGRDERFLAAVVTQPTRWRLEFVDMPAAGEYSMDDIISYLDGNLPPPALDPEPPSGLGNCG